MTERVETVVVGVEQAPCLFEAGVGCGSVHADRLASIA
jgi:hypothetical protein